MKLVLLLALTVSAIATAAEGEKVPPMQLKTHSEFHVDLNTRTPFWPIGWVRPIGSAPKVVGKKAEVEFQLEAKHFQLTSVLLGNPPLATINGRAFGEGETLPVMRGGERLKVIVRAIRDGGVTLDYNKQRLFVPIRLEVATTKPGEVKPAEMKDFTIQIPDK